MDEKKRILETWVWAHHYTMSWVGIPTECVGAGHIPGPPMPHFSLSNTSSMWHWKLQGECFRAFFMLFQCWSYCVIVWYILSSPFGAPGWKPGAGASFFSRISAKFSLKNVGPQLFIFWSLFTHFRILILNKPWSQRTAAEGTPLKGFSLQPAHFGWFRQLCWASVGPF